MEQNDYWNQSGVTPEIPEAPQAPVAASEQPATAQPGPAPQTERVSYTQPAYAPSASYGQSASAGAYAQPQKRRGWIVGLAAVVCLTLLGVFAVHSCTSTVTSLTSQSYATQRAATAAPNSIGIIEIAGTIQYDDTECSPEGLKELLDKAEDDDNIVAVVLRVNSGGGTATAGEEMAEYVRNFSKPIVVSSASVNASAAYEISSQADYIYVAKSTEIGAIGTAMQLTDLSGLLDKLGISMDVITSSDEKDSTYGYRPLTDDERAYYQDMIDQINQVFIENVADGRGMSVTQVKALATGLPFTGIDPVKNGLADEVGTREDAIAKAAELAGVGDDYDVFDLEFSYSFSIDSLLWRYDLSAQDLVDLIKERAHDASIQ